MFFAKVLVIAVLLALILIAEAQPRRDTPAGNGRPRPLPDRYRRDRQKGRGRRKGGFMKKFFDDSCLPTDCTGNNMFGFSMLVNETCPIWPSEISKENFKTFKEAAAKKSEFCDPQNSKVCTYCVQVVKKPLQLNLISNDELTMTKPETCVKPKDLKSGTCA